MIDSTQAIRHEKYVENNEEFDFTTYNDITVIIHVKSGYYNAGKLCSDNGKRYPDLSRNQSYISYLDAVHKLVQKCTSGILFEFNEGFSNKVRGTYVHPLLVDYICTWISPKYRIKVATIMNTINKELHLRNMKLDEKIKEMDDKVKDLCLPINRSK